MAMNYEKKEYPKDNYTQSQSMGGNDYLKDIRQIEQLCRSYDLDDAASNKRLHRYLKDRKAFSTWIGKGFLIGLGNRSQSGGYRRMIEKCCKIVVVSFLVLAIILVAGIGYVKVQEVKQSAVLDYIRQERLLVSAATEQEAVSELTGEDPDREDTPEVLTEYAVLHNMYPNVVGWLKVDGTPIDYPVMRNETDEDYYLNHNFQGETDSRGALFIDHDSSVWPLDENLVIYGHNMKNNSIFGSLDNYLDQSFYEEYNRIEFDTLYEKGTYQIVAVVKTAVKQEEEDGFRYYWFHNYGSEEDFEDFLKFIKENQVYDTGELLQYGDNTIMLSTCEYSVDNGRLVVIAKRI